MSQYGQVQVKYQYVAVGCLKCDETMEETRGGKEGDKGGNKGRRGNTRVPPRKYIHTGRPPHISNPQPTAVISRVIAFSPRSLTRSEICPTAVLTGITVRPKTASMSPAWDDVQSYSFPENSGRLSRYACCTSFNRNRMQKVAIMGCTVLCQEGIRGSGRGLTGDWYSVLVGSGD